MNTQEADIVKKEIATASHVALTSDLWTSEQQKAT